MSDTIKPEVLRPSSASIAKNEATVPHNELTPAVVRSIGTETQAQKNRDNFIVTGLITEDVPSAVCDSAKEIGVTPTDTSFKVQRFGKQNKHVEIRFTDRKLKFDPAFLVVSGIKS